MTGHIKTAAYAGECRLCPPPLFLILVSFLQIGFFIHQVLKLAEEGYFLENPCNWSLFESQFKCFVEIPLKMAPFKSL